MQSCTKALFYGLSHNLKYWAIEQKTMWYKIAMDKVRIWESMAKVYIDYGPKHRDLLDLTQIYKFGQKNSYYFSTTFSRN